MADRPAIPPTDDGDAGRGSRPGTPRWVKVFAVIAAIVILVFVILLVTGNDHGPGRHSGSDDVKGHVRPADAHSP
jgi:hypothetical protein